MIDAVIYACLLSAQIRWKTTSPPVSLLGLPHASDADKAEAHALGARAFLDKPFAGEELFAELERIAVSEGTGGDVLVQPSSR